MRPHHYFRTPSTASNYYPPRRYPLHPAPDPPELPPHPSRLDLLKTAAASFRGAQAAGFRFVARISGVSSMVGMKIARLLTHPVALVLIAGFVVGTIGTEYILQRTS